jgi:hypothetical protein
MQESFGNTVSRNLIKQVDIEAMLPRDLDQVGAPIGKGD